MKYIHLRYPGGLCKAVTFSYDDGCRQDIRLAKLFSEHGLKAAFNIRGDAFERNEGRITADEIREYILTPGHEVAIHGHHHVATGAAHPVNAVRETLVSREILERTFDSIIRGMAYPDTGIRRFSNGNNYETVKGILASLGVAYSRTLAGDNNSFELPTDWYAWMPTAHHNNPNLTAWIDEFLSIDVTKSFASGKYPRLLKIWGHSHEFDRNDNWDLIEDICRRISGKEDIWYATPIEICEYAHAYDSLIFSADTNKVYNPTCTTVWFYTCAKTYKVSPGETVLIEE